MPELQGFFGEGIFKLFFSFFEIHNGPALCSHLSCKTVCSKLLSKPFAPRSLLFLGLLKDEEEYGGVRWGQHTQGHELGSHPGWQNWRGSISGMFSADLLTGQHGWLCKCGGNSNKNWFYQNRKIIRTIPALQKRYTEEVNCISRGLKACSNCTQNSISNKSRATPATGVQKELRLFLPPSRIPLPTSPPSPQCLLQERRSSPLSAPDQPRQQPHSPSRKNALHASGAGRDRRVWAAERPLGW